MKEKLFKNSLAKRLLGAALMVALMVTFLPVSSTRVYAAEYSNNWLRKGGPDNVWCSRDSATQSWDPLVVGDILIAHKNWGSGGVVYLDKSSVPEDGDVAGQVVKIDGNTIWICSSHSSVDGAECETCGIADPTPTPDPTPCEHAFTDWTYAPSVGDEWRYCSKCHIEERRAVASSSNSSSKPSEPAKTDIEVREALEETMPVSPVSVDTTQFNKTEAAIIPGGTYNLSNFITIKGIVKGINTAVAASNKSGSNAVTIYSGRPFAFNGEILKAIQAGKKDVTYFFNHDGHLYSVTIPATVDATKVLEKTGFAGPLYVGQQLGTTVLIK